MEVNVVLLDGFGGGVTGNFSGTYHANLGVHCGFSYEGMPDVLRGLSINASSFQQGIPYTAPPVVDVDREAASISEN